MIRNLILLSVPVAVALGLTACNRAETSSLAGGPGHEQGPNPSSLNPERRAAFEKEAIAIKARSPEGEAFEKAMGDLLVRYGFAVPNAATGGATPLPDFPEDGPVTTASGAAGKAAATTFYKRVKNLDITYPFALYDQVEVHGNMTMTAFTEQVSETVDPYMVAFYHSKGKQDMDKVTIVGLDDDGYEGHGRNSRIQWKNDTSATRTVTIIVFAYGASTTGSARLKVKTIAGGPISTRTGRVHTTRTFFNSAINTTNCTGPYTSRIGLKNLALYSYGTGILAVDVAGMKGGNVRDVFYTLDLGFVLTPTGGNFVLPYLQDNEGETHDDVENHYNGWQEDRYSCSTIFH